MPSCIIYLLSVALIFRELPNLLKISFMKFVKADGNAFICLQNITFEFSVEPKVTNLDIWRWERKATLQIHDSRNPIPVLTGFAPASLQVVHLDGNAVVD